MTFKVFLESNPSIDWIISLFELLVPTMMAIITIIVSHRWDEKRYRIQKKNELKIGHLEKCGSWLEEIMMRALEISRMADNCLNRNNPDERWVLYRNFVNKSNDLTELFASRRAIYERTNNSLEIDLELEGLRVQLDMYLGGLRKMCEDFIRCPDTTDSVDINKNLVARFKAEIEKRSNMLADEMIKIIK